MKTLKVKPWGNGQGDYVLINEEDFNPEIHVLLDAEPVKPKKPSDGLGIEQLREALKEKGIEFAEDAKKAELKVLLDAEPVV